MKTTTEKIVRKIKKMLGVYGELSYAQCGEDLVLNNLFNLLGIEKPYYLDIEAHHPKYLSNTYMFYKQGGVGICVEPDPLLFKRFAAVRRRDLCLNLGVGKSSGLMDFYRMSVPTVNTFSKSEADMYVAKGSFKIKSITKVNVITLNEIFEKYATMIPDLVSIDVEGLDLEILQSTDLTRFRPKLFCVETLTFDVNYKEMKVLSIIDFMATQNYVVVADTWLNTIFVKKELWSSVTSNSARTS